MAELRLHPGSEPLPKGGDALLERLRTVLEVHFGDERSDGWCVAIDTRRRDGQTLFSVVIWQESAGGQWLGEPFMHSGAHGMPVEERFAAWLAEREAPVPALPTASKG